MTSDILIYQNPDGNIKIDVRLQEETVWLTQAQMGQLFGKDKRTISEHSPPDNKISQSFPEHIDPWRYTISFEFLIPIKCNKPASVLKNCTGFFSGKIFLLQNCVILTFSKVRNF